MKNAAQRFDWPCRGFITEHHSRGLREVVSHLAAATAASFCVMGDPVKPLIGKYLVDPMKSFTDSEQNPNYVEMVG